jgi:hypothetical protein
MSVCHPCKFTLLLDLSHGQAPKEAFVIWMYPVHSHVINTPSSLSAPVPSQFTIGTNIAFCPVFLLTQLAGAEGEMSGEGLDLPLQGVLSS